MKAILRIITLAATLAISGCATRGLPSSARIVGGGAQIEWQSPQNGTGILVERRTGRIIATRSLLAGGEPFSFNASVAGDSDVVQTALGERAAEAEFVLYFVPSPPHD